MSFRDFVQPGRMRKGLQRVRVPVPLSGCLLISLLANDFRGDEGGSLAGVGRLLQRLTHFPTKPRPPRCLYWLCFAVRVWKMQLTREKHEEDETERKHNLLLHITALRFQSLIDPQPIYKYWRNISNEWNEELQYARYDVAMRGLQHFY